MPDTPRFRHPIWVHLFLILDLAGFLGFLLGFRPGWFGLDRSYVIGYVQVFVFIIGIGLVFLCTFAASKLLRPEGQAISLREDLGGRFAASGFVLAAFSGAADLVGLGSHPLPGAPHFGLLQSLGLVAGLGMMLIGLVMHLPGKAKPAA